MPYLEILAAPIEPAARHALTRRLTDALCDAFAIAPDIVTIYFVEIAPDATPPRPLAKLHAYARDIEARRRAAVALTGPLAAAYDMPPESIALYFLDRAPDEVAHGGRLSADVPA